MGKLRREVKNLEKLFVEMKMALLLRILRVRSSKVLSPGKNQNHPSLN